MKIKNVSILYFFLSILFNWHSYLLAGLKTDTQITIPTGSAPLIALTTGSLITGYDLDKKTSTEVKIKNIGVYSINELVTIETDKGTIHATEGQFFYECVQNQFVPAINLKIDDLLFTKNLDTAKCINITSSNELTSYCHIELDSPHLFFSSDAQILTHNMCISPTLLPAAAKWLVGTVVACVYFHKAPEIYINPEQGKDKILKKVKDFVSVDKNWNKFRNTNICRTNSKSIEGIKVDSLVYTQIMKSPALYGPMCVTAVMQKDGKVECSLNVYKYLYTNYDNYFNWESAGKEVVDRDHPFVKVFIEQEDKKQLDELNAIFKTWSQDLVNKLKSCKTIPEESDLPVQRGCFEPVFFDTVFSSFATYCMIEKRIAPFLVLYTLKYGECRQAKHPERFIYLNAKYNACAVVDKKSKRVLAVGHYNSDIESLDTPKEEPAKTVDDILNGTTPGEETNGKTKQFIKVGGYKKAVEDFDSLKPSDVRDMGNDKEGKIGKLADGRTVNVRTDSTYKTPTLEIYNPINKKKIKIRYI